jgi:hypothetical protein
VRWQSKGEVWFDIFFVVFFGLVSSWLISNNWIKAAIWTLTSVMLVLLVIWYIYLYITPSLNERVKKRMHYIVIILKCFYVILALLITFNFFGAVIKITK